MRLAVVIIERPTRENYCHGCGLCDYLGFGMYMECWVST
jgi:hypothetical protein